MFSANSSQVSDSKLFVEDVFSTYLYTGNGSTQTITNGIDLAGKGGLVWFKQRSSTEGHGLFDTQRGVQQRIQSNTTGAQFTTIDGLSAFNANGFSIGGGGGVNASGETYASWTFREAPKFFDVVTYTGDGTDNRSIAHSLGVAPGMIIIKQTSGTSNWRCYHRSLSNPNNMSINLNGTQAASDYGFALWSTSSTNFSVNQSLFALNSSGQTYVAYLYAHDATADGLIQCGSYTADNSTYVNLGWEPQFIMYKRADSTSDWYMVDNMRGFSGTPGSISRYVAANLADAEQNIFTDMNATGFFKGGATGGTYIYIAIRRGPMRTPTLGTSVFSTDFLGGGTRYYNSGFPTDMAITNDLNGDSFNNYTIDRLRGGNTGLRTHLTNAEYTDSAPMFDNMDGIGPAYAGGTSSIQFGWLFRRAPGFFDEVCYTGTTSDPGTIPHNLGVPPEMMIVKRRNSAEDWMVYAAPIGANGSIRLNRDFAASPSFGLWGGTAPTATNFTVSQAAQTFEISGTYVNYLFASAPGVSKVGSYTGNGSSQTINCGFAAGARFVMIKRTDSTGDWYVWDSARGIVAGNDPHMSLNTAAAQVTTDDSVDTDSSGFVVNQVAATNVNVNAATYIYLAIA